MAIENKPELDLDFPTWAETISTRSNRSLAGSRLVLPPHARIDQDKWRMLISQAQQWGMTIKEEPSAIKASSPIEEPEAKTKPDSQVAHVCDFDIFPPAGNTETDFRQSDGATSIAWAQSRMPILSRLIDEVSSEVDFRSARIGVCLILEPKTAVLLRKLKQTGAQVGVYCEPGAVDQRVADQLKAEGIPVYANATWGNREARQGALNLLDRIRPNLIIDDGASFARLAQRERPELASSLVGVAEETTSGVRAFQAMEEEDALTFPVIAVNDSSMKTDYDNAHGTGETCLTTVQALLGTHCFQDCRVLVIGYGPVGRGFALGARALGARVTVSDTDPRAALRAVFEGFTALDTSQALAQSDMVISATGVVHTIDVDDMKMMKPGAVLGVIGGVANEIALDQIPNQNLGRQPISTIRIPSGPELTLLGNGDGLNYTVGGGNPIEIMDLSFAVQISAITYLLKNSSKLQHRVYRLPEETDRHIASLALKVRGYQARKAEDQIKIDWRTTRFDTGKVQDTL